MSQIPPNLDGEFVLLSAGYDRREQMYLWMLEVTHPDGSVSLEYLLIDVTPRTTQLTRLAQDEPIGMFRFVPRPDGTVDIVDV